MREVPTRNSQHVPSQLHLPLEPKDHLPSQKPTSTTVQAGYGYAFAVKQGQKFRITDLYGGQIIDFLAWKVVPPSAPPHRTSAAKVLADPHFHSAPPTHDGVSLEPRLRLVRLCTRTRENRWSKLRMIW